MAVGARGILALAVLESHDFRAPGLFQDFGLDLDVLQVRLADLDILTVGIKQDFVQDNALAFFIIQAVGLDDVAFADLELAVPQLNYGKHNKLLYFLKALLYREYALSQF